MKGGGGGRMEGVRRQVGGRLVGGKQGRSERQKSGREEGKESG